MKKILICIALALFLFGCEKIEPTPEKFTFNMNGEEMNFSENISVYKDIFGDINIQAKKTGVGIIRVTIEKVQEGFFTENDYVYNREDISENIQLTFLDKNNNIYDYRDSNVKGWFKINIKKFENRIEGEVSGEFSGLLHGNLFNEDSAIDSVQILNGEFSTTLNDKIN